jgi:imidazolonepropionase-like amidohydrolase
MWQISTAFAGTALYALDPGILDDRRLRVLNQTWAQRALETARDHALRTSPAGNSDALRREDDTVAALYHAGGGVSAGIDSFSPGLMISLILGLRAEVLNGLKPWEALQTVPILPARHFGYGRDLGSIEPGKIADLDIVDGNPLENINDMARIAGVMVNGRYYTPAELMKPFQK